MDTRPDPKTLQPAPMVDSDHPVVREFAARHARGADDRERAVALYLAVRDGLRYDPYRIDLSVHGMKASTAMANGYGWCVPKATLLAAACRAAAIPARVGYADVRNHLSTERMRQNMDSDLFVWHGYTDIWLDGQWLKATPAFNIELCERFGLLPLDFDGRADSIYHPFDRAGNRHMEYVAMHGAFDEVPLKRILDAFAIHYPKMVVSGNAAASGDFMADAACEAQVNAAR
ncbi:MAG: transglutaminase domain-containing protein [Rubrivivax sp.]